MCVFTRFGAVLLLFLWPVAASAKDYVRSSGALSDKSFYRLVACGAAPDRPCQHAIVHWPKPLLTVGFVDIDKRLTRARLREAQASLANAVDEVNQSGAGIRLRIDKRAPDIQVFLSADRYADTHFAVRDIKRGIGRRTAGVTRIFFENYKIQKAVVVIAAGARKDAAKSVMLEEVVQALGLPTDIRNAHYHGRSIFSETSNQLTELGEQDSKALQLHYPRH